MINNDDISEELAERINECVIWHDGPQVDVAKVVGLLLDAGLVSPPCWAVRDTHGNLVKSTEVYTSKEVAEHDIRFSWGKVEHWKGQTE